MKDLTIWELYKLYNKVSIEIFLRTWWVLVIVVFLLLVILYYPKKEGK